MKATCLLLFTLACALQTWAQADPICTTFINGKQVTGGTIPIKDLANFCTLQLKEERTGKMLVPVTLEWVISSSGRVFKGNWRECTKIATLLKELKKGDILFIDKIKFKGMAGLCEGQFAFTIN